MKVLILGGTQFTGPYIVEHLVAWGHQVTVFHRGSHQLQERPNVSEILGDRSALADFREPLAECAPDVVIDMIAFTTDHARQLLDVFDAPGQRLVVISSIDVYRAYGRFRMTEPGPPDLIPLLEDDPLREKLLPESAVYDKVGVEQLVRSSEKHRATILRLPMIYGPNDGQHRFREYLQLMDGGAEEISLAPDFAEWRCATGFVGDVGHAIALTAKNSKAIGKTYNVADSFAFTQLDLVRAIGRAAGWTGRVVTSETPTVERPPCDYSQHLVVDSSTIRTDLGYIEETPINEAIAITINWERADQTISRKP